MKYKQHRIYAANSIEALDKSFDENLREGWSRQSGENPVAAKCSKFYCDASGHVTRKSGHIILLWEEEEVAMKTLETATSDDALTDDFLFHVVNSATNQEVKNIEEV